MACLSKSRKPTEPRDGEVHRISDTATTGTPSPSPSIPVTSQ